MPINYPTSLDALANPTSTTLRNAPGFSLSGQVSALNDIAEALEAKLGIGASTPGASAGVLRRTAAGTSAWGTIATADIGAAQVTGLASASASSPANNNSTTRVAIPGTATPSMTTTGGPVLVFCTMIGLASAPAGFVDIQVWMDAGVIAQVVFDDMTPSRSTRTAVFTHTPSAAAHVWDIRWIAAATCTDTAVTAALAVLELKR